MIDYGTLAAVAALNCGLKSWQVYTLLLFRLLTPHQHLNFRPPGLFLDIFSICSILADLRISDNLYNLVSKSKVGLTKMSLKRAAVLITFFCDGINRF